MCVCMNFFTIIIIIYIQDSHHHRIYVVVPNAIGMVYFKNDDFHIFHHFMVGYFFREKKPLHIFRKWKDT